MYIKPFLSTIYYQSSPHTSSPILPPVSYRSTIPQSSNLFHFHSPLKAAHPASIPLLLTSTFCQALPLHLVRISSAPPHTEHNQITEIKQVTRKTKSGQRLLRNMTNEINRTSGIQQRWSFLFAVFGRDSRPYLNQAPLYSGSPWSSNGRHPEFVSRLGARKRQVEKQNAM